MARSTYQENEKMVDSLRKFKKKCNFRSLSAVLCEISLYLHSEENF